MYKNSLIRKTKFVVSFNNAQKQIQRHKKVIVISRVENLGPKSTGPTLEDKQMKKFYTILNNFDSAHKQIPIFKFSPFYSYVLQFM